MAIISYDYLMNGTFVAIGVIIVVKLVHIIMNRRKLFNKYKHLPQEQSYPILGDLWEYPGPNDAGLAYQRDQMKRYPRLMCLWIGHIPVTYVQHPETAKIILKSSEPKAPLYIFFNPWLGQGLLTSSGIKWARNRRLLTQAFHFDILKDYISLKNSLCDELLSKFEEAVKSGESLTVFDNISLFTLDVMLQSTMSFETGCQRSTENHPYTLAVNRLTAAISMRFLQPWCHSDFVYFMTPAGISFKRDCNYVHKVADEVITKRRNELEEGKVSCEKAGGQGRKHTDFLDTLLMARDDDGNGLTNKEIRDEVDTFLFEGHDTTASAISWCLYAIAEHPDVQSRVQKEIDDLLADRENDYLMWEDMSKLPYLTMVIKESMRLHVPVPYMMRLLTKDVVIDGYDVPADTKFDPERFSPEQSEGRDPFAFIPFSAGPRNCIGQNFAMDEIKICLTRILHRYAISLDPTHVVTKFSDLVMKAENDIKLIIKSRSYE